MTLDTANINSLSDFNSNCLKHIERLKATGDPEVLTVDGKVELVVQDARAYQELLKKADFAETVQAIRSGMNSHARGEGISMRQALEQLAQEVGFSLDN